jgi:predicted aconitase with swiveling domain
VRGTIVDPRHPQAGASIAGTVLYIPEPIGSSSSSAIMLELIREGTAPAAVVLGRRDAILALGAVVALELGYAAAPVVEVVSAELGAMPDGTRLRVVDGDIERVGER